MRLKQIINKPVLQKVWNYLFIGMLLLFLFNSSAKAWLLRQFLSVGLFSAEIKKEAIATNQSAQTPAFSFTNENGSTFSTAGLKGKVVFVNFWATWCPPCRAEMPGLMELYNQFRNDDRFVFLFLNEDSDRAKANAYLQEKEYDLPLHTAAGNVPAEVYSGTLPTTVIINKEGMIVFKHEGLAKYNSDKFINQLRALQ